MVLEWFVVAVNCAAHYAALAVQIQISIAAFIAIGGIQIVCYAVFIVLIMVIIFLIYAKDNTIETTRFNFQYIWKLTSEDLADSINSAAKSTEQLAETAKDIQEAAKDFANIGRDIPRALNVTMELSPSEGVIDFIAFRYVPLIAFALFVLTFAVLYFVFRSYIKWKIRREELQTVIRLYEYERAANEHGTPEGFVESLARGFEGKTRRRSDGALLDV